MVRIVTVIEDLFVTILEGIIDRIMRKRYPLYSIKDFERDKAILPQSETVQEQVSYFVDEMVADTVGDRVDVYEKGGVPHEVLELVAEEALEDHAQKRGGADITVLYPHGYPRVHPLYETDQSINQIAAQPDPTTHCFNEVDSLTSSE